MKGLKNIVHPHAYILFFIVISLLALIPNGFGWRIDMLGYTQKYVGLSLLYVLFYFLGYYIYRGIKEPEKREVNLRMINLFHIIYGISFFFFLLKFIYIGGIPLINDAPYLRTKMGQLGGFVDYPTKTISLLGIVAFYLYEKRRNKLYIIQFILSLLLNILFAERSLVILTLVGVLVLYLNYHTVSLKTFITVLIAFFLMLFFIGWIQIIRLGGKEHLDLSGKMSTAEVAAWVVQGDLTGSQKFGAYIVDQELNGDYMLGRYTLGTYISVFIPSFEEHGAEYLQKEYTNASTAQSAAIPYSYFMDFGYFSLIFPFFIGGLSRFLYTKYKSLNSPFYILIYPAYFFSLLWSVRAGNFPVDPKLIYFFLVLLFIFSPVFYKKMNNEVVGVLRILYLFTIIVSFLALIIRW